MSVFTPVSDAEARALLEHYALGELERLEGIAQGVENTNYFLTTTTGEYVLTLFEHIPRADLPFYVGLMDHLAHREVTCPLPMRRDDGEMLAEVNGKPAVHRDAASRARREPRPDAQRLPARGRDPRAIHVAGVDYDAGLATGAGANGARASPRRWRRSSARAENELIAAENRYQAHARRLGAAPGRDPRRLLPRQRALGRRGPRRRDRLLLRLRRRPALRRGDRGERLVRERRRDARSPSAPHAFVEGYEASRPLEDLERELWPAMLRRAALRTWLGRLGYNYFPRDSHMTIPKDHAFSRRLLEHHVAHARALARPSDGREHQGRGARRPRAARLARGLVRGSSARRPLRGSACARDGSPSPSRCSSCRSWAASIANFLQPAFFASFAIAAYRQARRRAHRDGRPLRRIPAQPTRAGEPRARSCSWPSSRSSPLMALLGLPHAGAPAGETASPSPNTPRRSRARNGSSSIGFALTRGGEGRALVRAAAHRLPRHEHRAGDPLERLRGDLEPRRAGWSTASALSRSSSWRCCRGRSGLVVVVPLMAISTYVGYHEVFERRS